MKWKSKVKTILRNYVKFAHKCQPIAIVRSIYFQAFYPTHYFERYSIDVAEIANIGSLGLALQIFSDKGHCKDQ